MNDRIAKIVERIQHFGLDALLISSLTNIRYLFGFTGSNAIALIASGLCFFITDRRYETQAIEEVKNAKIRIARKELFTELKYLMKFQGEVKIGVEAIHLTLQYYHELKKMFPAVKFIASERIVENIASVKEPDEVDNIKKAAAICQAVYGEITNFIKPGMRELEVSAEISYRSMRQGSERDPFAPIVASGKRSALPHGISSNKKIAGNELIILDFGATVNGYAADFTRTVITGTPDAKQKEMGDFIQLAIKTAEMAVKPGMTGKQLDSVARTFLQDNGFGNYFQHSLGHGLGLNVHELPRIGERSSDPIQPGNVIALEPGIYIPDYGGVRIEDDFLVTSSGIENLTPASREAVCVG